MRLCFDNIPAIANEHATYWLVRDPCKCQSVYIWIDFYYVIFRQHIFQGRLLTKFTNPDFWAATVGT